MTTLRLAHKRCYTSISNGLAQNPNISLKALGLMVYLLSLPDDWRIHVNHLIKVRKEGRDAIMSAIKELKELGYIHLVKKGFQEGWEYFVFESPVTEEEFKNSLRTSGIPNNRIVQQLEEQPLQKTNRETKEKIDTNLPPLPPPNEKPIPLSPPTKEEEEEISRRLKERPQNWPRIVNKRKWRQEVLKDIRNDCGSFKGLSERIDRHKSESKNYNDKIWRGDRVYANKDWVEFTSGSYYKQVRYDVSDEEWKRETGWE